MSLSDIGKPRPFDVDDPESWFQHFESVVCLRELNAKAKLCVLQTCIPKQQYQLAGLAAILTPTLKDDATEADITDAYKRCKAALLHRFSKPTALKARELIYWMVKNHEAGNPHEQMAKMQSLFDLSVTENHTDFALNIFREIFLYTQPRKATEWFVDDPPTEAGQIMDRLVSHTAVCQPAMAAPAPVFAVKQPANSGPQPRTTPSNHNPTWCWYHNRYGNRAKQCKEGCTFKASGNDRASCQ